MTVERLGYRPELDGLRGVAILLVLGLHWWPSAFPGGGVGVDVFFVLSGFLITRLLIEERAATGAVSLRRFWSRRVRRLMPAYLALLVAFWWVDGAWWSATYLGNWGVIAGDVGEPLRHTWSLAIEEQFYAVWPVVFVAVPQRVMPKVLGAGVLAMWVAHSMVDGAAQGLGTFTRPAGLLVGCALAFGWPFGPWARTVTRLWPVAVGALVAVMLTGDRQRSWELALVATAVLLVAVVELQPTAPRWLVRIGVLSYSLYLWHYPITVLLRDGDIEGGSPGVTVVAIVCTFVAAWLSLRLVERRFRHTQAEPSHDLAVAATQAEPFQTFGVAAAHAEPSHTFTDDAGGAAVSSTSTSTTA